MIARSFVMLLYSLWSSFVLQQWIKALITLLSTSRPNATHLFPITIRNASLDDVTDIARIIRDAFAPAPHWQYVYQHKDRFPHEHLACLESRISIFLQTKWEPLEVFAHVIDSPDGDKSALGHPKPVAVALWALIPNGHVLPWSTGRDCQHSRDINMTRKNDYDRQAVPAEWRLLVAQDHDQLYLSLLATSPEWQGHGLGEAHLEWGQNHARTKGINITLLSTPAGYPVYRSVGFESVENVTISKIDGDGFFWFEWMVWEP